jgi:hypothetical protein
VVDQSGALLWLHLVKDKRFTTGATIPYLLGGLRIANGLPELASEDTSLEQLRRLLMSMRDDLSPPTRIHRDPALLAHRCVRSRLACYSAHEPLPGRVSFTS